MKQTFSTVTRYPKCIYACVAFLIYECVACVGLIVAAVFHTGFLHSVSAV